MYNHFRLHRLLFPSLLFIFLNKYTSVKNNLNQYIWQKFEDFFHTFPLYAWWNFYLLLRCIETWDDRECVFKTEKRGNFLFKKKFNFGTKLFLIIKFLSKKCLKRKPGTEYHQFKFCTLICFQYMDKILLLVIISTKNWLSGKLAKLDISEQFFSNVLNHQI